MSSFNSGLLFVDSEPHLEEHKSQADLKAVLPWEEAQREEKDIGQWIVDITGHHFANQKEYLRECDDGAVLCELLMKIDDKCVLRYQKNAKRFWAKRDNVLLFQQALQERLDETAVFEISDLLEQEGTRTINNQKVILGLASLAFWAYDMFRVTLPGILRERQAAREKMLTDQDIDTAFEGVEGLIPPQEPLPLDPPDAPNEPALPRPADNLGLTLREVKEEYLRLKYQPVEDDEIDYAVDAALRLQEENAIEPLDIQLIRIKKGQYLMLPHRKLLYMTTQSGKLMVRVGGGWIGFDLWYERQQRKLGYRPAIPTTIRATQFDRDVSEFAVQQECQARSNSRNFTPPRARSPGRASRASTPPARSRRGNSSNRFSSPGNSGAYFPPLPNRSKTPSSSHMSPSNPKTKSPTASFVSPRYGKTNSSNFAPPQRTRSPGLSGTRTSSPPSRFHLPPSAPGAFASQPRHSSRNHHPPVGVGPGVRAKSPSASSSRPRTTSPAARVASRRSCESFSSRNSRAREPRSRSPKWQSTRDTLSPSPSRAPVSPALMSVTSMEQLSHGRFNSPGRYANTGGANAPRDPCSEDEKLRDDPTVASAVIIPKSSGIRDYTIRRGRRRNSVGIIQRRAQDEDWYATSAMRNEEDRRTHALPDYQPPKHFDPSRTNLFQGTKSVAAKQRDKFTPPSPKTPTFRAGGKVPIDDRSYFDNSPFEKEKEKEKPRSPTPEAGSPSSGANPMSALGGFGGGGSGFGGEPSRFGRGGGGGGGFDSSVKSEPAGGGGGGGGGVDSDPPTLTGTRMRLTQLLGGVDSPDSVPAAAPDTPEVQAREPSPPLPEPNSPTAHSDFSDECVDD